MYPNTKQTKYCTKNAPKPKHHVIILHVCVFWYTKTHQILHKFETNSKQECTKTPCNDSAHQNTKTQTKNMMGVAQGLLA